MPDRSCSVIWFWHGWLARRVRDLVLPLVVPLGQRGQEHLFAFRANDTPLVRPN